MAMLSKGCIPGKSESHNSLCETNLDNSFDSGNFSVKAYLPLIWKDFITDMCGLAGYVKEELPFVWGLSLEHSAGSYLCFQLVLLHLVLLLFPLYITFVSMYSFLFYFI